ncbi:hypothetical protein LSTR_LSTR003068 [Laodelphax striatellus]|uniref:Uncharacterized protein n=1 Tax=Laodelphax striatellus TaxID=195883 RepID=A0A482WVN6_LAOST|nr:hypothetical protein LSTR_LSTR003068 [Laodelphax striatellus]
MESEECADPSLIEVEQLRKGGSIAEISSTFAAGMSSTLANEEETSWKGNPPTRGGKETGLQGPEKKKETMKRRETKKERGKRIWRQVQENEKKGDKEEEEEEEKEKDGDGVDKNLKFP